jgi:hypothetical protein
LDAAFFMAGTVDELVDGASVANKASRRLAGQSLPFSSSITLGYNIANGEIPSASTVIGTSGDVVRVAAALPSNPLSDVSDAAFVAQSAVTWAQNRTPDTSEWTKEKGLSDANGSLDALQNGIIAAKKGADIAGQGIKAGYEAIKVEPDSLANDGAGAMDTLRNAGDLLVSAGSSVASVFKSDPDKIAEAAKHVHPRGTPSREPSPRAGATRRGLLRAEAKVAEPVVVAPQAAPPTAPVDPPEGFIKTAEREAGRAFRTLLPSPM